MMTSPASSRSLSAAASRVATSRSMRVGPHASGAGSGSALGVGGLLGEASVLGAGEGGSGSGACGPPGPAGVHAAQKSPAATARTAGRWWRIGAPFTTRVGLLHHRERFRCDLPAFAVVDAREVGDEVRAEVAGFLQHPVADLPIRLDVADGVAEVLFPAHVLFGAFLHFEEFRDDIFRSKEHSVRQ